MGSTMSQPSEASTGRRAANLRTALLLVSIALVFFGGIILAQLTRGTTIGISVLGFGIIGFLLIAIGGNARKQRRE